MFADLTPCCPPSVATYDPCPSSAYLYYYCTGGFTAVAINVVNACNNHTGYGMPASTALPFAARCALPYTMPPRVPTPIVPTVITWHDGKTKRRVTLTSTKAKPPICNPILALATVLSWARLLPSDTFRVPEAVGTAGVAIPLLSERLGRGAPVPPPLPTVPTTKIDNRAVATGGGSGRGDSDDNGGNDGDGNHRGDGNGDSDDDAAADDDDGHDGDGDDSKKEPSHTLSIGAAWMLGHQVFRPSAGGVGGVFAPAGQVGVAAGEAVALRLLSCPDISWAPDPEAVMQALEDGEGSMRVYTVSAFDFDGSRETYGRDEVIVDEKIIRDEAKEEGQYDRDGAKENKHDDRDKAKANEHDERKEAKEDVQGGRKEVTENEQENQEWGSEARAACEELIGFGLCEMSANGSCLALCPEVGTAVESALID